MKKTDEPVSFGREQADSYDERWVKLAPMIDGLHFLSRIVLSDLPADGSVLCVGAGTGSELIALAQAFPACSFTAVDPSGAMLDVCRKKAERAGVLSRCQFHEGYLNTLAADKRFDAATSILVSQFLPKEEERRSFFREILRRLNPGSSLISADLASPVEPSVYGNLMEFWVRALMYSGFPRETAVASTSRWGHEVAVSKPKEIEAIMASSGFEYPTLFYQALFIHAWHAKVPSHP
ncbi:class I SAM-dependent methyltransferase [Oligoflexus tunisiensis]|uniref:class I SAM-dependent methyltransferase n=1 Tax=Oligoflexus tunisiensis TaxID=708132 RepID=UPI000A42AA8E|nr:class I SAM-dependent methyltransferase [Oligoflexus tunisiensis]